jgi:nucleolar complex protein 2
MKAKTIQKPKLPLENMSVDDFLDNMNFDADSDDDDEDEEPVQSITKTVSNGAARIVNGKEKTIVQKQPKSEQLKSPEVPVKEKKPKKDKKKKVDAPTVEEKPIEQKTSKKKLKAIKVKAIETPNDSDAEDEEEEEIIVEPPKVKTKKEKSLKKSKTDESKKLKKTVKKTESDDDDDSDADQEHTHALEKLKSTDPEFYEFLENNDRKLLKFSVNEDSGDSDEDDTEEKAVKNEKVHKPDEKLEVASDESDFDEAGSDDSDEEGPTKPGAKQINITIKMLKEWERELQSDDVSAGTIKNVTVAFRSALQSISTEDIEEKQQTVYRVEGAAIFNGIVQVCVLHLQSALVQFLKVKNLKFAKQSRRFKKIIGPMRTYLPDVTKLLETVVSTSILTVLLKHLHQLAPIMPFIFNLTKPILKRLIILWATSEDSVRVLAFLCILKITRDQQSKFLKDVLRIMYLNYVKNCKFVSPNTLPGINFMRRSLAEMFGLDMNVSYNIVFMFVRQLAIHLRNAYTERSKENVLCVYNWQYVNSLRLWGDVLSITHNKAQLQPLLYPLVTIVTGVIRLIPSAQYYPVRFHCCKILVDLAKRTNTFIPVLPFMLEVLQGQ